MALRVIGIAKFILRDSDGNQFHIQYSRLSNEGVLYAFDHRKVLIFIGLIKVNKCWKDASGNNLLTFQCLNVVGGYQEEEAYKIITIVE